MDITCQSYITFYFSLMLRENKLEGLPQTSMFSLVYFLWVKQEPSKVRQIFLSLPSIIKLSCKFVVRTNAFLYNKYKFHLFHFINVSLLVKHYNTKNVSDEKSWIILTQDGSNMLGLIVCSLVFGIGIAVVGEEVKIKKKLFFNK